MTAAVDQGGRLVTMVAATVADRRPAAALLRQLEALDAAGDAASAELGTALFESVFYRLPAFPDATLPAVASRLYASIDRVDMAFLLAGLAIQSQPAGARAPGPYRAVLDRLRQTGRAADALALARRAASLFPERFPADPVVPNDALFDRVAAKAEAIAELNHPGQTLLLALDVLEADSDWVQTTLLFESVWHRVPPLMEYWVYYRMSRVYDTLGRTDASVLLATLAIQIEPQNAVSDVPYRRLLRHFRDAGRPRDAAELCLRREGFCADPVLLPPTERAELLEAAGTLLLSPAPAGRRDQVVVESDTRLPHPWPVYGGALPNSLRELLTPMPRPPISVAMVSGATVLIDGGGVAVFGADEVPHLDLSVRDFPALLRRRLAERAAPPVEELHLDAAVLISDEFFGPNLCHFLLDQVTRIELYRRAGVDPRSVTVIGPERHTEYQRLAVERMGLGSYLSVSRCARVQVDRLWVSSNCHDMRHPAHWASDWAVGATRALFDLVPRQPRRRLLVSRANSPWRRIANEAEIADILKPLGFEVVVPGMLSFLEQIAAFRDATHVIAPHGAALANTLFCAPGTHVLEVFHPHYGTWAYAMLNDVLRLNYASMVGRDALSDAPEFNDPTLPREQTVPHAGRDMRVDVSELRRWLTESGAW